MRKEIPLFILDMENATSIAKTHTHGVPDTVTLTNIQKIKRWAGASTIWMLYMVFISGIPTRYRVLQS